MKRVLFALVAGALFLFACDNVEKKVTDETKIVPTTIPSASFNVIMLQHPVKDFSIWQSAYIADDSVRKSYGISAFQLGRELEDSNKVIIINKISEGRKAKDFADLPALREKMKKSGVTAPPEYSFVSIIRNDDAKTDQKDVLLVTHRVKDFNSWLKVYDDEGMLKRREHGLVDRSLGRDMNDSNKVYILFAVDDMVKAKARVNSEELKKLMTDAGVEGVPQTMYYKLVE
jgi:hypothetical protein